MEVCDKVFVELISSMQRRQREVTRLIRDQEKTAAAQAEEQQLRLLEEITKLRRRSTGLEQLSHADDRIHLIQVPQTFLCRLFEVIVLKMFLFFCGTSA